MSETRNLERLGQSLAWLLALVALLAFTSIYLPSRQRTQAQANDLMKIRDRITKAQASNRRLESMCIALETRQPYAVKEAIREVLHKGDKGEFVLEQ